MSEYRLTVTTVDGNIHYGPWNEATEEEVTEAEKTLNETFFLSNHRSINLEGDPQYDRRIKIINARNIVSVQFEKKFEMGEF